MLNTLAGIIASSGGAAAGGDYESIATVTVGSGGASSVTFSSIPSTYQHLQLRIFAQVTRATYGRGGYSMRVNSDSGNNYSQHDITGNGDAAQTVGYASQSNITLGLLGTTTSNAFGATIVDLLDYKDTNKYKTIRSLGGVDHNGLIAGFGGIIGLNSNAWYSTSAISSIVITPDFSPFTQYSSFALYGIKG